jgi:hypothetical protein
MLHVMLQKFQNDIIKREIIFWEHDECVWWNIIRKSICHDFLSLNDDHEWRWIIVDCIDHFNDRNWFAIFRINWIKLFDVIRHDDLLFCRTFNSKFIFIEIDEITSFNLQLIQSTLIFIKLFFYVWFLCDLISLHCQRLDFDHIQFVSFSSFSKSRFWWRWSILSEFQSYNITEYEIKCEWHVMN